MSEGLCQVRFTSPALQDLARLPSTGGAESASRQPKMGSSWGVSGLEELTEQSRVRREITVSRRGMGRGQGP